MVIAYPFAYTSVVSLMIIYFEDNSGVSFQINTESVSKTTLQPTHCSNFHNDRMVNGLMEPLASVITYSEA